MWSINSGSADPSQIASRPQRVFGSSNVNSEFVVVIGSASPSSLLRKRFTVLFRPGAISGNCLQGWTALGSASARTFHLGLGHAGAGLCFQASTDVYDRSLHLCLALSIVRRILSFILRTTARWHECQQTYQSKKPRSGFQSICHNLILLADIHSERLLVEPISGNVHLT